MLMMRKVMRKLVPYVLLLPAAILLFFFVYGVVNGVLQGFGYLPFLGKTELTLEYYIGSFTRPSFSSSIWYSAYLAATTCVIATVGGVLLSAALCCVRASRRVQLLCLRVPMNTSSLIIALVMMTLFTSTGLVPRTLYALGLISDYSDFPSIIGSTSGYGIIIVYAWRQIAFVAYFTIAIMAHIGDSFSEAAATLGASPLKVFFSLTLPLCRTTILRAALIAFAAAFGSYEIALLLGPTLPQTLPVAAYMEFTKVDLANRAYGMALNGIASFVCVALSCVYYLIARHERKVRRL